MKNWYNSDEPIIRNFTSTETRWLSNMWLLNVPIVHEGIQYPSSENLYQALKVEHQNERSFIASLSPSDSKKLRLPRHQNAEMHMRLAVRLKFDSNPDLKQMLIDTGDKLLVEGNWWNDDYWGVNKNSGVGRNLLGIILMDVRSSYMHGSIFHD